MSVNQPTGGAARASITVDTSGLRAAVTATKNAAKEVAAATKQQQAQVRAAEQQRMAELRAALTQRRVAVRTAAREELEAERATKREQATLEKQRTAELNAALRQRRIAVKAAAREELEIARAAAREQRATQRAQGGGFAGQFARGFAGALAPIGAAAIGGAVALGVSQAGRAALEADALATTYKRQSVAAEHLAGSQGKLNELLAAYEKATGGAVDKATALAQVTRLMAVGFADSAEELTRVTTIARGAALAMGQSQDFILSQMQLAIANQSTMRLDQIGVGVEEFNARLKQVRATNAGMTTEVAYQVTLLGLMEEKFGSLAKSQEAQATGAEKAAKASKDLKLALGELAGPGVSAGMNALANIMNNLAADAERAAKWSSKIAPGLKGLSQVDIDPYLIMILKALPFGGPLGAIYEYSRERPVAAPRAESFRGGPGLRRSAESGPRFTDDQTSAIRDWASGVQQIERDANRSRIDATTQYESQRSQAIAQYATANVREEEDFQRSRLRAAQNLAKSIARVGSEAAEREAEWVQDRDKRIAKIREEGNDRIAEQEADYAKERERAGRDHRDRLLSAAARLDAAAVFEEQTRFARESKDAEDDHKETMTKEREQQQERIDQENEAHDERLDEARKADAKRIEEMRESLEEAQRIEDEDRAIRKDRQAEDHARQLSDMAAAHAERQAQIKRQAADERAAHHEAFQARLAELGLQNEAWKALQDAKEKASLESFDKWWEEINKRFRFEGPDPAHAKPTSPAFPPFLEGFAKGGYVARDQVAKVHRGEYIMTARETAVAARNGGFPGNGSPLGANSRSLTIAPGAIVVHAAPGQNPEAVAAAVDARLEQWLDRWGDA